MNLRRLVWPVFVPLFAIADAFLLFGSSAAFQLVVIIVFAWVVTGVALTIAVFISEDSNTAPRWQAPVVRFLMSASVAVIAGYYLGGNVHESRAQRARAYVAGVLPELDGYFRVHKKFPNRLSELPNHSGPHGLGLELQYEGDNSEFRFEYPDRGIGIKEWVYSSDVREWRYD